MRRRRWALACGAYGVLVASAWVGAAGMIANQDDARQIGINTVTAANEARRASIKQMTEDLTAQRATLDANRAIGEQPDWSQLMVLLASLSKDKAVLRSCELRLVEQGTKPEGPGGGTSPAQFVLDISGVAKTQSAVTLFTLGMESDGGGLFQGVTLRHSTSGTFRGEPAVLFDVQCRLGGNAP